MIHVKCCTFCCTLAYILRTRVCTVRTKSGLYMASTAVLLLMNLNFEITTEWTEAAVLTACVG